MKNSSRGFSSFSFLLLFVLVSCKPKQQTKSDITTESLDLKRGALISCGPADQQFGKLDFDIKGDERLKEEFNLGVKMLHSFEYDEAEKVFAAILDKEPNMAMAYWGVAMSNFHPLWTPPTEAELIKGEKAIQIAASLATTEKEKDYINPVAAFFTGWQNTDHITRTQKFEKAMEGIYKKYPEDIEGTIFYALALNAAADPMDKTFSRQKKAGEILNKLYTQYPDHPGIIHYIIHTYDSPEMAANGLAAAKRYASVAPSSAHALHMPSHIFTRLGLWKESVQSNRQSVNSAICYAESSGIKGHWDEELHGLDYLMYAYLQLGETDSAKKQWDYLAAIKEVSPVNFKVAYAFAAIPSRYYLENKLWEQASKLEFNNTVVDWKQYPWQTAIIHFTRSIGLIRSGKLPEARNEIRLLKEMHALLVNQKDSYKSNQVQIQVHSAEAWLKWKEGKKEEALSQMMLAADMEDKTEKHPVTPCEVIPARELLADMYLEMGDVKNALLSYEKDLAKHPNRLNSLAGAAKAAEKANDKTRAIKYYNQLLSTVSPHSQNENVRKAKAYLSKKTES